MKEVTVDAKVESIGAVTDFVNAELEAWGCPMKAQIQIDVAIDELFSNIAHYAYNGQSGTATVRIELIKSIPAIEITFIDRGMPYDPLVKDDPDVTLSALDRQAGGLGIFLVKKTMDKMTYEFKNGQNIVRILKKI